MIRIEIDTDNAAFHDDNGEPDKYVKTMEVVRILRKLCDDLEIQAQGRVHVYCTPLLDIDGNVVGDYTEDAD